MLSLLGFFDGITALLVAISCSLFGAYFAYESRKTNAKLLLPFGLSIFFIGFVYLGQIFDFFTILLTGINLKDPYFIVGIIMAIGLPPAGFFSIYGATELLKIGLKVKRILIPILLVLCTFLEFVIFIYLNDNFVFTYPNNPGDDLIQINVVITSPFFITFSIIGILYFSICGIGELYRGIKTTGIVRKKYLFISIGSFLYLICATIDFLFILGYFLILVRILVISGPWFWYFGFRVEPEKPKEVPYEKEIKVEESIFRLTKRPNQITEEEVSISKEKQICLICKGILGGFLFKCKECGAFYCEKCAHALTELENACWVCNGPIDDSKPSKPYKEEEEEVIVEGDVDKKDKSDDK